MPDQINSGSQQASPEQHQPEQASEPQVSIINAQKKNWTTSDWINFFMTAFTFLLFLVSFGSLVITRNEIKFTDSVVNANLKLTQQSVTNGADANNIAKGVAYQDSVRFEKENRPYFQIINVRYAEDLGFGKTIGIK